MNSTYKKRFFCFRDFTLVWTVKQFEGVSQIPEFSMMVGNDVRAINSGAFAVLLKGRELSPPRERLDLVVLTKRDHAIETRRIVFEYSFRDVLED